MKIKITVDTNDADYETKVSDITPEKLEKIKPLLEAIKHFKPYKAMSKNSNRMEEESHDQNYPKGESCRKDLGQIPPREFYKFPNEIFDIFEHLCPYSEFGFHTVVSVETYEEVNLEKLI